MNKTSYAVDSEVSGFYKVVFVVNDTGKRLVRGFDSEYQARQFVNKLKHSSRCRLVSYPIFN